jgi:hypothetical protein
MPKILTLKQLKAKAYKFLEGLPQIITDSFGMLPSAFIMIVWGMSGQGKSNFIMQLLKVLMHFGKVLYISLEEGYEASFQMLILRHLGDEALGKIEIADSGMDYDSAILRLKKKKSPSFIIIDSLQYWNITYDQYKELKRLFPRKTFIFISHAAGKVPDGKTADKIRYDAGIKVRVEGYVATVISRYGGNKPYIIWEEGARRYWDKDYRKVTKGSPEAKPRKEKKKPEPVVESPITEPI